MSLLLFLSQLEARALIAVSITCLSGGNHDVDVIDVDVDVAVELGVMLTVDACMQYALYSAVVIGFSTVTVTVLSCDLGHHGHGNTGKLCMLMCCTRI